MVRLSKDHLLYVFEYISPLFVKLKGKYPIIDSSDQALEAAFLVYDENLQNFCKKSLISHCIICENKSFSIICSDSCVLAHEENISNILGKFSFN